MNTDLLCSLDKAVPSLVYYSHISIIVFCILMSYILYIKGRKIVENQILIYILTSFNIWVILSLVFWISNKSYVIMTAWSLTILIEPIVYLCCLYLIYYISHNRHPDLIYKLIMVAIYLPIVLFLPTKYTLSGFDISTCLSIEGPIALYYTYIVEILCVLLIFAMLGKFLLKSKDYVSERRVTLLSTGVILLLVSFGWGNIIGSYTDNWIVGEFGLLGMPVFITFLVYNIIKFDMFELKKFSRNLLIFCMWILVGSLVTLTTTVTAHIVTVLTFIISVILGLVLMRIAKNEDIHLREKSVLAASLGELNSKLEEKVAQQTGEIRRSYWELSKLSDTKDMFISIAQHNLRIPITNLNNKIEGVLSGNVLDTETRNRLLETKDSLLYLTSIADEFKSISKIKPGAQILNLSMNSILSILENILSELNSSIQELKLTIAYPTDIVNWPKVNIDSNKFKDALIVIIENAVKYNIQGGYIKIHNNISLDRFTMTIENSGLGITNEEMRNIGNQTFYRSERVKNINPIGMGIGMSLAKSVIEAHHGPLIIESKGENTGAKVTISIPINFLNI